MTAPATTLPGTTSVARPATMPALTSAAPRLMARGLGLDVRHRDPGLFTRPRRAAIVSNIDLEVAPGEILGLVGESGSGKTTIGRMLAGEIAPDRGRVLLDGAALTLPLPPARRRAVQLVFQDTLGAFDPRMTLGRQLDEPLVVAGLAPADRRRRIDDALDAMGLDPALLDRWPHQVSGGQRQRAVLARALSLDPSVLVLDEPVSALDVSVQAQVVNHLAALARDRGLAMVFISHDLGVVGHLAHRVAVLYLGRVVETGPVEAVFGAPAHPYTRALLDAVPVAHPGLRRPRLRLEGEPPAILNPPTGCAFHPRCPLAEDICRRQRPEPAARTTARHLAACHLPPPAEA
ncbi:ABC transporter ATP-binding protein [Tistrella mobilis]|uniref:oligopeptide/dipeptide ABC transporter ATP-binding protein n=1 Tax=Tistrella mobilis TaxID=171437 RepID=UPI00355664B3